MLIPEASRGGYAGGEEAEDASLREHAYRMFDQKKAGWMKVELRL